MATEAIALVQQQAGQKLEGVQANDPSTNKQLLILQRAKISHETRSTTATIQVAGWGATCGCYVTYALGIQGLTAGFDGWGLASRLAKMGASCGLTAFYALKLKASKDAAEKMETLINDLETKAGKGKCDPFNNIACYCSQLETKFDPKYCLPKEFEGRKQAPQTIVTCIDSKMKSDPGCNCKVTDSCYDSYVSNIGSDVAFSRTNPRGPIYPAYQLMRGSLGQGAASSSTMLKNLAAGKKYLKENDQLNPSDFNLNKAQKQQAMAMMNLGVSPGLAAKFASNRLSAKGQEFLNSNKSQFVNDGFNLGSLENNNLNSSSGQNRHDDKTLYFESNNAQKSGGGRGGGYDGMNLDMLNKLQNKNRGNSQEGGDSRVLNFANKAFSEAQINKKSTESIFNIISYRYKMSVWTKFNVID